MAHRAWTYTPRCPGNLGLSPFSSLLPSWIASVSRGAITFAENPTVSAVFISKCLLTANPYTQRSWAGSRESPLGSSHQVGRDMQLRAVADVLANEQAVARICTWPTELRLYRYISFNGSSI
ncbi:hypothetical protein OBBRIDRAFT_582040 [Obba rivulosa]|uniref:Uncharacterized protein n=1 Tax=Obba rivulosa TaxID=1052685 RepID=A0A8E2AZ20_9APHY|nr:hypothetical protein OBBRIDRAFT_582040 [Obba rivulosa]